MNNKVDNILFASINLPILDKALAAKEILALPANLSFWDSYRHTKMIPLSTKGGRGQYGTTNFREGDFEWVHYAPKVITEWFDNIVFPFIGTNTRVMALLTPAGSANNEHIDCAPTELNTRQHKFRIVLQGRTDTLYWLTNNGHVKAPDIENAFIMDGGWPHGMINSSNDVKVTLALGAPWTGNDHYGENVTVLQNRNDYKMPEIIDHLWKK